MDPIEITQLTSRLRRQYSRQPDVLNACAELERFSREEAARIALRALVQQRFDLPVRRNKQPKRDRALYMRDYRKRRKA